MEIKENNNNKQEVKPNTGLQRKTKQQLIDIILKNDEVRNNLQSEIKDLKKKLLQDNAEISKASKIRNDDVIKLQQLVKQKDELVNTLVNNIKRKENDIKELNSRYIAQTHLNQSIDKAFTMLAIDYNSLKDDYNKQAQQLDDSIALNKDYKRRINNLTSNIQIFKEKANVATYEYQQLCDEVYTYKTILDKRYKKYNYAISVLIGVIIGLVGLIITSV